ncbi:hypothetical protein EJD97_015438 [Solanum chilense]|uniref:TF-B3 domain-containing protein n=1 Tax=Solanum chilense TaxID=4083 RepID=A0A6N2BBQ5_SOLCI|nr:hypothetical protein EJD97_015438 [Solanum chilense]
MVKLEKEDIEAALLLSWLKYVPVFPKKEEKSKRKHRRFIKNETPEIQIPKRVKNSPSASGFEVYGAGNPKRVRVSSNFNGGLAASSSRNSNPVPKRGRVSPSNLPGSLPKFPPIENLTTLIGQCSNPFVKQLTNSDVNGHQGRFLLSNEYVRNQLLPLLNEKSEDLTTGISVKTFDPMGKYCNMTFKTWGNHKTYLLLGSWKQFVQEHGLKVSDCVTGWMFRHNRTGELCFALTW